MSFLWIHALWLLLLIPLLVFAYFFLKRRRNKYTLRYASLTLLKDAAGKGIGIRRYIPPILFLISLIIAIFALTRPVGTLFLPSEKGTIILAIDVSLSMGANDIRPNRFEAAKSAAISFIKKQPPEVCIGIVSFSGMSAIVQEPTTDHQTLFAAISQLTLQERTAIGSAITTSLDAIFLYQEWSPISTDELATSSQKAIPQLLPKGTYADAIIILLSDGQNNTGLPPLYVVEDATELGVRIHTVGMGNPTGKISGFASYGSSIRLDEPTLICIAERTDGQYYRVENATALHNVYETLGKTRFFKPVETELTAQFAGIAIVFMITAGILSLLWFNRLP